MLRLILIDRQVEVHYLANGKQHTPCGTKVIGVDKGYSEVFADSEGRFHGEGFNRLLTPISHARMENNRARNKLGSSGSAVNYKNPFLRAIKRLLLPEIEVN